jgi:hypothetical protein
MDSKSHYSVLTDHSRQTKLAETTPLLATQSLEANFSILSVLLFVLMIFVLIPVYSVIQDRKDLSFVESQITAKKHEKLITAIAMSDEDVAGEWRYKQDEIQAYSNMGRSLFSHLLFQRHPWMNVFLTFSI